MTEKRKKNSLFFPHPFSLFQKTSKHTKKGAELPVEEVPFWQSRIVQGCRKRGKPVIVATNMLESMIQNPTPTRAEVSDISIAVREGADAVMLSGETAFGSFPHKAVSVMRTVATRTERAMRGYAGTVSKRREGEKRFWFFRLVLHFFSSGGINFFFFG